MSYHVALIADNHFINKDKAMYVNGTYTKPYLKRFTSNFDQLTVIARVKNAQDEDLSKMRESGGAGVDFCELPDFNGIKQYSRIKKEVKKRMLKGLEGVQALFVRMPCILTTVAFECAKERNIPVMIDVGADPDSIYRSARTTLFELLVSKYMMQVCKRSCKKANGVSYVTSHVLQKKYPCRAMTTGESSQYFTAAISNADIAEDFYTPPRSYDSMNGKVQLLHISNNICEYSGKGHTESVLVLKKLVGDGIDAAMTFVGEGTGMETLQRFANENGVGNRLIFTGRIADRGQYKKAIVSNDIFLFPSHSEGLPRVLLEVMATGMVCITSNVDGIPEIVSEKERFEYSDVAGMARRIEELMDCPQEMQQISQDNLKVAKNYSNASLKKNYDEFYGKVRKLIDEKRIVDRKEAR